MKRAEKEDVFLQAASKEKAVIDPLDIAIGEDARSRHQPITNVDKKQFLREKVINNSGSKLVEKPPATKALD